MKASIYEVFNDFLLTGTWHMMHRADAERFYCALRKVVNNPTFDAQQMRAYMKQRAFNFILSDEAIDEAVEFYEGLAETVHRYLKANCPDEPVARVGS